MIRLYDHLPSGNAYKVRLLLSRLGIAFERIEHDIVAGETRTAAFLAKFPNGRVPAVEFDDGRRLFESNAIIWYFADGTAFLPDDRWLRAEVMQWLGFEQYSHEPYIATVRHWVSHLGRADDPAWAERIAERRAGGVAALGVMEGHLETRPFFVGGAYSIADISLFAYTHVADEGGFDLAPFPAVRAWIDRVAAVPGHIPITWASPPAPRRAGGRNN